MDSTGGTSFFALTTQTTLVVIDVCHVVVHGDSFEFTHFLTLRATDTSSGTSLLGHGTLVVIATSHVNSSRLGTLVAQFKQHFGTSFHTSTTCGTFFFVDFGQSGFRIDSQSAELTNIHAVAHAQAAVATSSFTTIQSSSHRTRGSAVVVIHFRTIGTRAVTTQHSHLRSCSDGSHTQDFTNLAHGFCSTHGAKHRVQTAALDAGFGKAPTTGITATATIGTRQNFLNLIDARIFFHIKGLGCQKQNQGEKQTDASQHNQCNYNRIHNY